MVMDDKVLLRKIKYSMKSGQSRAQITRKLQSDGYKLEYINKMIARSKRPKKVLITLSIIIFISVLIAIIGYLLIFNQTKIDLLNPLAGYTLVTNTSQGDGEITLDEIEITPEFLSYLLNELGAWELRKHPLTREEPIINFEIGEKRFHSIVGGEIETFNGENNNADVSFVLTKEDTVKAILSEDPAAHIKNSFTEGRANLNLIADEKELFAKGYLTLYDNLK